MLAGMDAGDFVRESRTETESLLSVTLGESLMAGSGPQTPELTKPSTGDRFRSGDGFVLSMQESLLCSLDIKHPGRKNS